jgi:hypothetical protein
MSSKESDKLCLPRGEFFRSWASAAPIRERNTAEQSQCFMRRRILALAPSITAQTAHEVGYNENNL